MDWLNSLKVAIITKDVKKISTLINEMPKFKDVKQMKEAQHLIKEAYLLISTLKEETLKQINQIKKNINFLESTMHEKKNSLDVMF